MTERERFEMRDRARRRMMGRDARRSRGDRRDRMDYGYGGGEYYREYADRHYAEPEYEKDYGSYQRSRQYDRGGYPFEVYGEVEMRDAARRRNSRGQFMRDRMYEPMYMRDGRYDYGEDERLGDRELMEWSKDLLEEVPEQYKSYFTVDNIERKAKEMGIDFDKFSFSELYTTTLMMVTDYKDTLGMGNMDTYLRLAKDWLCDKDVAVKYGAKLATYYDEIVNG